MPFENLSAVAKMKLDPDQFGFYAEERAWLLKKACLKTAAICPAFDSPRSFQCMFSEMLVTWQVMAPRTPVREKRITAVLMK
ncbi:unnamed protein product [Bubo scandiacus]